MIHSEKIRPPREMIGSTTRIKEVQPIKVREKNIVFKDSKVLTQQERKSGIVNASKELKKPNDDNISFTKTKNTAFARLPREMNEKEEGNIVFTKLKRDTSVRKM